MNRTRLFILVGAALAAGAALVVPPGEVIDGFQRAFDAYTADANTSGELSDKLALAFVFQPGATAEDDAITISLENRSYRSLKLCVEPGQFHGRIIVTPPGGAPTKYLDSTFIVMLMTGIWIPPTQTLASHEKITWTIPVRQWCDIHQQPLDRKTLNGATVLATLDEVAVVPRFGGFISDNAKQISSSIVISIPPQT